MPKQKPNKKDKRIFWAGVTTGIVGGLLGNIWVEYFFRFFDNPNIKSNWINCIAILIFTLILFGLLFWINKQIKINK